MCENCLYRKVCTEKSADKLKCKKIKEDVCR